MYKVDAVIFDWAGTTVDFGSFAPVRAFMEVFKEYGVEPTVDEIRKPMGMLKIEHIKAMLDMPRIRKEWKQVHGAEPSEEDAYAMNGIFEEKLLKILKNFAEPKPDTLRTVKELRRMGIAIGSTTGYTDKMMSIVAPAAGERGYKPDIWFSPDSTGQKGRPYPYMIFKNMEALNIKDVRRVLKVGDTVSDIKEGKSAGVLTAGVVVGSSQMGLSREEYETLEPEEREKLCEEVKRDFLEAGADEVFLTLDEVIEYIA